MSGFYPHGKPGVFAYTQHFVDAYGGRTGYLAEANTKYPGLNGDQGHSVIIKALWNLQSLINSARAAELAFLRDTGIELSDPNASNIFRNINEILNSKETFERGLKYMEELSKIGRVKDEKTHTYRDVSSFLETYLNQELKQLSAEDIIHMTPAQIKQEINNVIGNALKLTYTQVKDFIDSEGDRRLMMGDSGVGKAAPNSATGEQAYQAITDMISAIEKLQKLGDFGRFGYLFQLNEQNLAQRVRDLQSEKNKNKGSGKSKAATGKYNETNMKSNYQGNALELITSTVAAMLGNINIKNPGLTIQGSHTGQLNQMKADSMLFVAKAPINVDEYFKEYSELTKQIKNSGEDSVRMQNVQALRDFLDKLSDKVQHVIMISDKNYSIKADFDGIEAQDKMRLQDAGRMLSRFGVDQITELITYLANCGSGMVQGAVNDAVRTELQSYIGYFLFDHLHIEIQGSQPSVNVVNLMNVSGLYIPLSVYLEGLYNSIQDAAANPSSFVSVSISLGGPTVQSVWTAETWAHFREEHETQSFLSYKILKNIAEFISGL